MVLTIADGRIAYSRDYGDTAAAAETDPPVHGVVACWLVEG